MEQRLFVNFNNCWRLPNAPTPAHTGRSSHSSRYFRKVSFTKNIHNAIIHTLIIFFIFLLWISNAPLNTLKAFQFPVVAFIILISVFQLSQTRKQCVAIVVALKPRLLFLEGVWVRYQTLHSMTELCRAVLAKPEISIVNFESHGRYKIIPGLRSGVGNSITESGIISGFLLI